MLSFSVGNGYGSTWHDAVQIKRWLC